MPIIFDPLPEHIEWVKDQLIFQKQQFQDMHDHIPVKRNCYVNLNLLNSP